MLTMARAEEAKRGEVAAPAEGEMRDRPAIPDAEVAGPDARRGNPDTPPEGMVSPTLRETPEMQRAPAEGRRAEADDTRVAQRPDGVQVRSLDQVSGRFSIARPALIPNPGLADSGLVLRLMDPDADEEAVKDELDQVKDVTELQHVVDHLHLHGGAVSKSVMGAVERRLDRVMKD